MTLNFHETSYRLHIEHTKKKANSRAETASLPSVIASPDSIDAFRHARMYEFLRPLVNAFPPASWMTVGDTGADAYFLREMGAREVTATSLSCDEINTLKEQGHLESINVKQINAEQVGFPDESFDFVLCKSTYHHLPRAPLAFYELLRVCRQGVVYIEPAEFKGFRICDHFRSYTKLILRKQPLADQLFERSGNFIYRLCEKEIRKQSTAIQLDAIAYKYFNDFFYAKLSKKSKNSNSSMLIFKLGVGTQDLLCSLKLMNYARLALVVFKKKPAPELCAELKQKDYRVEFLPKNPFLA